MKSVFKDVYLNPNEYSDTQSHSSFNFDQNSTQTDPRIAKILQRAEEEYFREKQRRTDQDDYYNRKQILLQKQIREREEQERYIDYFQQVKKDQDRKNQQIIVKPNDITDYQQQIRTLAREEDLLRSLKQQTALSSTLNKLPVHDNQLTNQSIVENGMPSTYQPLRCSLSPKQREFTIKNSSMQQSKGFNFPSDNSDLPGYELMLQSQPVNLFQLKNQKIEPQALGIPQIKTKPICPITPLKSQEPALSTILRNQVEMAGLKRPNTSIQSKKPIQNQTTTKQSSVAFGRFTQANGTQKQTKQAASMKTVGGHAIGSNMFTIIKKTQKQANKLVQNGDYQLAKQLVESNLNQFDLDEPSLFYLCGEINLALGYVMIAEQMFTKCCFYPGYEIKSLNSLAQIAEMQSQFDRAIQYLKQSLEVESSWQVSYKLGTLLLTHAKQPKQAIDFLTFAVESAQENVLTIEPETLGKMYVTRMKCYKELGLEEHAKLDYQRVLYADPNFIQRELKR